MGCHIHSALLTSMLRSVNIPAYTVQAMQPSNEAHGATYVPTLDSFVHGDLPLSFNVLPSTTPLIVERVDFLDYIKTKGIFDTDSGNSASLWDTLKESEFPYSKIMLSRTNNYTLYFETNTCQYTAEDIETYEDEIQSLLPEFEIYFEEHAWCGPTSPNGNRGTYKMITNQIPVKTFNELVSD